MMSVVIHPIKYLARRRHRTGKLESGRDFATAGNLSLHEVSISQSLHKVNFDLDRFAGSNHSLKTNGIDSSRDWHLSGGFGGLLRQENRAGLHAGFTKEHAGSERKVGVMPPIEVFFAGEGLSAMDMLFVLLDNFVD